MKLSWHFLLSSRFLCCCVMTGRPFDFPVNLFLLPTFLFRHLLPFLLLAPFIHFLFDIFHFSYVCYLMLFHISFLSAPLFILLSPIVFDLLHLPFLLSSAFPFHLLLSLFCTFFFPFHNNSLSLCDCFFTYFFPHPYPLLHIFFINHFSTSSFSFSLLFHMNFLPPFDFLLLISCTTIFFPSTCFCHLSFFQRFKYFSLFFLINLLFPIYLSILLPLYFPSSAHFFHLPVLE